MGKNHENVLCDPFIRGLHKRMFKDVWKWAGIYRKNRRISGSDLRQITVQVHDLCKDAAHWIQAQTFLG